MVASSIYVDPNYAGTVLYPRIEGMFLLHDRVDVYCPNGYALEQSLPPSLVADPRAIAYKQSEADFFKLVRSGRINPIVRQRYLDKGWRNERVKVANQQQNSEGAAFFAWRTFDDLLSEGPVTLITDEDATLARQSGEQLPDMAPEVFKAIESQFGSLARNGQLPVKYLHKLQSGERLAQLCRELAGDIGGDVQIMRRIGSHGLLHDRRLEDFTALYDDVGLALSGEDEPTNFVTIAEGVLERLGIPPEGLTRDDELLAQDIVDRVAARYRLADVIEDYHASGLATDFRHWIFTTIRDLRKGGRTDSIDVRAALARQLELEEQAARPRTPGVAVETIAVALGTLAGLEIEKRLRNGRISRRRFLTKIGFASKAAALGGAFIGASTPRLISAWSAPQPARWLSFLVELAPEKWD